MNITINHIIFLIVLIVSVKLYMDHRKKTYKGIYNIQHKYKNITPLKHDLMKFLTIMVFLYLIYGNQNTNMTKLIDTENIYLSYFGLIFVVLGSLFIYYEAVEPYITTKIAFI